MDLVAVWYENMLNESERGTGSACLSREALRGS
jgi:hypothetical protein